VVPSLFGLGAAHETPRELDRLRDLRDRSRLAQLLMARGHAPEALQELDKIELTRAPVSNEGWDHVMGDPSVRWLRARALEDAGRREEGAPLMGDPAQVFSSYGPWWATRGRWARLLGDESAAETSFSEAVAADPLDAESACETLEPNVAPPLVSKTDSKAPLCAAARAASGPPFDSD
jgi:hypothetical protein